MDKIIINADDFGYSLEINLAIRESYIQGIISSTSIMANMLGFEDAIGIIKELQMNQCVGIHLNITDGKPLTKAILQIERFCDYNGNFSFKRNSSIFKRLTKSEKEVLGLEFRAQIARCKVNGVVLTHADSHQHIHTEWNIAKIAINVLKEEGISKIRISKNIGSGISKNWVAIGLKKIYKSYFNRFLRKKGFITTNLFGGFSDINSLKEEFIQKDLTCEIMCHPKIVNGSLVDENRDLEKLSSELKIKFQDSKMVSYNLIS